MPQPHASERSIFESAIDKSTPEERSAHLDLACAGNAGLRKEVEALLAAHDRLGSFPNGVPPPSPDLTLDQSSRGERPGTMIGRYKLLQQIGEGGMGTVFMAEQTHPVRRKVALKLIKAGMDSQQVIARFESERQALAMMDHVNIARALDAGTTETGLPYFVMELVHGVPISKYCDDNQLTPRQRLELFVPVCRAIQHAHQKGIIHRDIKPTNVMITLYDGKPVPKVIDFGVAKAMEQKLTERTLFTQYGVMVGTLEHMSPEQAEMSALGVDTRSDIYSLGVLLYELLTGSTPLSQKRVREIAYAEILRLIKEEDPPRPSTRLSSSGDALASISAQRRTEPGKLARLVRGELDWIVMKALEKDRNRRYETASAFAADIERYLKDEAVQACPPTSLYRFGKFARRNKIALTFATVILFFIVLLGGGIGWTARDRAGRQATSARQVQESLTAARTLLSENKPLMARQKLAEAKAELAQDRNGLGALASKVDAFDAELARFDKFFALIDRANEAQIPAAGTLIVLSGDSSHEFAGKPFAFIDVEPKLGGEVPYLLQALALYGVLERDDWGGTLDHPFLEDAQIAQLRGATYEVLLVLANDLIQRRVDHRFGQKIASEAAAHQTLVYLQKAEAAHAPTSQLYRIRIACWKALKNEVAAEADVQRASATPATMALDHYLLGLRAFRATNEPEAVKEFEAALRLEPSHYWSLMWLGFTLCDRGAGKGDFLGATVAFTGCIARRPEDAHAYFCRGIAYSKLDRNDEAIADFSKSIELNQKFAPAWNLRGTAYINVNQNDKAAADATRALELDPKLAPAWNIRGGAYLNLGQYDKAIADLNKAIELDPEFRAAWANRSNAHHRLGQTAEAVADISKAIELDPKFSIAWNGRGLIRDELGQFELAIADLNKAIELDPALMIARYNRGHVYHRMGQIQKALADFSKAIELAPKDASAWSACGLMYEISGQTDIALTHYNKAIELDPKLAVARYNRGTAYNALGQPEKAMVDLDMAVELNPKYAKAWANRGSAYINMQQYDKAVPTLSKAILLDPKLAPAWNNQGRAYAMLGQTDKAMVDLGKAIELDPTFAQAWLNRGNLYVALNQMDKAIADFSKAIELEPGSAVTWNARAAAYEKSGQKDKAVVGYSKAIELNPKSPAAWYNRGMLRQSAGQLDLAIADLSKAIELEPGSADDWSDRGRAYAEQGLTDKAIADFTKAIELDAKSASNWDSRGGAYANSRQWEKATADFSRALELDPKRASNWIDRGATYAELSQWDKAIADFSKGIELDSKNAGAWYNRGCIYGMQGRNDKAIADLSRAIELDPTPVRAWSRRGSSYAELGQTEKAIADFAKVIELDPNQVESLRNLAALLITSPDAKLRDPARALKLIRKAVGLAPKDVGSLQTLGWALCQTGAWKESIECFRKSMELQDSPKGGDPGQWFGLAVDYWQLGDKDEGRKWYQQAVEWMEKSASRDESLIRFRAEAEEILKIEKKAAPK